VTAITIAACATKSPPAITKDSAENQATVRKLEGYIRCLDDAPHTFEVADRYRERYATGAPTVTDDMPVQASSSPDDCIGEAIASLALEPHLPELDAAARAYVDALTETYALTAAMRDAFMRSSGAYDPARGAALHAHVLAAFTRFDAAEANLFDQIYAINRRIHLDQLSRRTAQEGRTFAVMTDEMMVRAEGLAAFASVAPDRLDAIDTHAMAEAVAALDNSLAEVTAYAGHNPKEAEELIRGFDELPRRVKGYVLSSKQLLVRARDHIPYTDMEKLQIAAHNDAAITGTPAAMIDAYNHILEIYRPTGTWPR
jgi:hypothetical protein